MALCATLDRVLADGALVFGGATGQLAGAMVSDPPADPAASAFALTAQAPDGGALSGPVERVVFQNPDTGFAVLLVRTQGEPEPVTLVGSGGPVAPGEILRAEGDWQVDPSYGRQFRARSWSVSPPSTRAGMEAYLASGMIKGIGKALAKKLLGAFGDDVFEVIERQPERLKAVPGIGTGLAERIVAAWQEQRAMRKIMPFLHSHGLSGARAARIFERYGARSIEVLTANPYCLATEIRGIGFASADQLAARLNIARDSPHRMQAGLGHVLDEAQTQGHCGLPRGQLLDQTAMLLALPPAAIGQVLAEELRQGRLIEAPVDGTPCIFTRLLHDAEAAIAASLRARAWQRPCWQADPAALADLEPRLGFSLATAQRQAIDLALTSRLLVITGGPGTGKTTLVKAILAALGGVDVLLAAPTGRAARRLSESSGQEARTLHRLLEAEPGRGFRRDRDRQLACDLLIVDEVSMVDVPLLQALLAALPDEAGLILVGDVDQLPSIGPGQVLADLIGSGLLPVVRLEQIFRQSEGSGIVRNAHRINQGLLPELARAADATADFYAIRARSPEHGAALVVELAAERIPARFGLDPVRDLQVLCPTNRGPLGTRALNQALQAALNPAAADQIEQAGVTFALGDKVMQIENDYERDVYNGDIGRIVALDRTEQQLMLGIDERELTYGFNELDRLVPAYAITVHKAQGSEYPAVILPLFRQHGRMLRRNLIYTAITRARRLVVLVVEPGALELAIAERPEPRRWSRLRQLLSPDPC